MLVGVEAFIAMWLRLPKFKYRPRNKLADQRGMTGLIYVILSHPGFIAVTCAPYDF